MIMISFFDDLLVFFFFLFLVFEVICGWPAVASFIFISKAALVGPHSAAD